ncbi:hypothetical protein [Nostoc sp.]|uniref:hypothetical protein n=1 Tax=Nostoc sp. TaxID=1180 RepID=UPI002FF984DF
MYGNNDGKWRSHFFKKADDLVKTGRQDAIKGLLLAVRDCYLSEVQGSKETDFIPQKLGKLAGFTPPANTPATIVQTLIP